MREGVGQSGQSLLTATKKLWRIGKGKKFLLFFCYEMYTKDIKSSKKNVILLMTAMPH